MPDLPIQFGEMKWLSPKGVGFVRPDVHGPEVQIKTGWYQRSIVDPEEGIVRFDGRPFSRFVPAGTRIAFLPQNDPERGGLLARLLANPWCLAQDWSAAQLRLNRLPFLDEVVFEWLNLELAGRQLTWSTESTVLVASGIALAIIPQPGKLFLDVHTEQEIGLEAVVARLTTAQGRFHTKPIDKICWPAPRTGFDYRVDFQLDARSALSLVKA